MNHTTAFIWVTVVIDLLWLLALIGLPAVMTHLLLGVYIPSEERGLPQIGRIRRKFLLFALGGGAIGILLAAAAYRFSGGSEGWTLAMLLIPQALCIAAAWSVSRRQALALKKERGWKMTDSPKRTAYIGQDRKRSVSGIPAWAYLLPLAIIAASAWIVARNWALIPDPMPVHFDAAGTPDRFQAKSIGSVYMLSFVQLGLTVLLFAIHLSLGRMPKQLDPKDPEGSLRKNKQTLASTAYMLYFLSLVITVMFSFMQARSTYAFEGTLPIGYFLVFLLLLILALAALVFYTKRKGLAEEAANRRFGDDRHWRGGLFYYNPDDPSFMTEKRYGLGWTFNFARPASWLIMAAITLLPIAAAAAAIAFGG